MSDLETAVERFLEEADAVYDEYEQGYVDADVALSRIEAAIADLSAATDD